MNRFIFFLLLYFLLLYLLSSSLSFLLLYLLSSSLSFLLLYLHSSSLFLVFFFILTAKVSDYLTVVESLNSHCLFFPLINRSFLLILSLSTWLRAQTSILFVDLCPSTGFPLFWLGLLLPMTRRRRLHQSLWLKIRLIEMAGINDFKQSF